MATKKQSKSNGALSAAKPVAQSRWLGGLGMYPRKRALTFQTEHELKKAIEALWDPADELYRMPRAPAGALTMVVPEEAVALFRARRFKFTEYPVIPAARGRRRRSDPNAN